MLPEFDSEARLLAAIVKQKADKEDLFTILQCGYCYDHGIEPSHFMEDKLIPALHRSIGLQNSLKITQLEPLEAVQFERLIAQYTYQQNHTA